MNTKQLELQKMIDNLEGEPGCDKSIETMVYLQNILETKDLPNKVIRTILAFPGATIEEYPKLVIKMKQEKLWK